jgi:dolichol-phosphate mannosyltransferase
MHAAPELVVVVPTLNERANVPELIARLDDTLRGTAWEVVFVDDDSPDGTASLVRHLSASDPRIRCVQRLGRRGLSSACVEGVLASAAPIVAVMDADLQHDERLLVEMLEALRRDPALDLAVGSRYASGGSVGDWGAGRVAISGLATRLSRLVTNAAIADPMSGFFMIRRERFEAAMRRLSGQGFKILLDLLASSPTPLRLREFAYTFRPRLHGASKLDSMVAWEYLMLIADKLVGRVIPVRFALFALIGGVGVLVNLIVLRLGLGGGLGFATAEAVATAAAMVGNFLLNNRFTYRDRRLRGGRAARGLAVFCLGCAVGAVANIGIAASVFDTGGRWWLAGLAGAVLGAVWNYAIASTYVWTRPRAG